jgi:rhodanese-related sulfurtransferase
MNDINAVEAKKLLDSDSGYIYLDVRTLAEFEEGHAPEAWNIPVVLPTASGEAMEQNPAFLPIVAATFAKNQPMIVGCRSGGRSAYAAELLRRAGYANVRNMEGGFGGSEHQPGWSQCGFPIEQGRGGERSYAQLSAKAS